jgi:hypothetical protein
MYETDVSQYKSQSHYIFNVNPENQGSRYFLKPSVHSSEKTHLTFSQHQSFNVVWEIIAVYCENHTKHIVTCTPLIRRVLVRMIGFISSWLHTL